MRHVQKTEDVKGSLKWIREAVNAKQHLIDAGIGSRFNLLDRNRLEWVSPLSDDEYAEYSDQIFLDKLGIRLDKLPLKDFWPERGPNWDALARTRSDPRKVFLVEAKAYLGELRSGGCQAGPVSLKKIRNAFRETQSYLEVSPDSDWTGEYYQYANRLAHLYLLRELNGIDAYLVYVCFLNDMEMKGPATEDEWRDAIAEAERTLGIANHKLEPYVAHVFIDVNMLNKTGEK